MFGPLYDDKHRFYEISPIASKLDRLLQKGLRERLLCDECEQRLSRYERYASDVFFGDAAERPHRTRTGFLFTKLSYKPLKLFFMTLLWRLGVTSIRQVKSAKLGPHLERLRLLILGDDPGDYLTYPAMVFALTSDGRHAAGLILPPRHTRIGERHVWAFVIAGFLFQFFVSNRAPPKGLWGAFLQPNGSFPVHVADIRKVTLLQQWRAEFAAAEAARRQNQRQGPPFERAKTATRNLSQPLPRRSHTPVLGKVTDLCRSGAHIRHECLQQGIFKR
jgi:hypothetical protein